MDEPRDPPADDAPPAPPSQGAADRAKELIGRVIAERYRIDAVVAMGSMGAVYRGEHVHMMKRVAIKVLHPETEGLPELVQRFERESIVGAHANHPNVAAATDFGKLPDGSYYLVLEYIEGITLFQLLRRGPLPAERVIDIARQIAKGLDAVHTLDIVHRDLKPRNVMVSTAAPGTVKLIDFGFAKLPVERFTQGPGKAAALTMKGVLFGTVGFMAPEITFGMHAVGPAADLYALGVILYEMLTGRHPFDPKEAKALFRCHQMERPPPLAERAPDREIPRALAALTMRLLEKAPDDRYSSAAAVVDALDEAERDPSGTSRSDDAEPTAPESSSGSAADMEDVSPAPTPVDIAPPRRRRSGRALWLLVATLGAIALIVWLAPGWRSRITGQAGRPPRPAEAQRERAAEPLPSTSGASAPSPAASAAPPPSAITAAPRPTEIDGIDGAGWRKLLAAAALGGDAGRGAKAIFALAQIDPDAFTDRAVIQHAALAATAAATGDAAMADQVLELLGSDQLGSAGADVLFQMASVHGGSRGAARAAALLATSEVLARVSPALRVAMDLRAASCAERPASFERIAREGDYRALLLLQSMRPPSCNTGGGCCLSHHPGYAPTVIKLGERLAAQKP